MIKIGASKAINHASVVFNIPRAVLVGEGRTAYLVDARGAVAIVLRGAGFSQPRIGRHLNRDHTTINHLLKRTERKMRDDKQYSRRITDIIERVYQGKPLPDYAKERVLEARLQGARQSRDKAHKQVEYLKRELKRANSVAAATKRARNHWVNKLHAVECDLAAERAKLMKERVARAQSESIVRQLLKKDQPKNNSPLATLPHPKNIKFKQRSWAQHGRGE
jgi:hypothetical protein